MLNIQDAEWIRGPDKGNRNFGSRLSMGGQVSKSAICRSNGIQVSDIGYYHRLLHLHRIAGYAFAYRNWVVTVCPDRSEARHRLQGVAIGIKSPNAPGNCTNYTFTAIENNLVDRIRSCRLADLLGNGGQFC